MQQWSKAILLEKLASAAHLEKPLDAEADTCYTNKEAEDGPQHPVVVAFRRCWFVSPFHEIAALLQDLPIHSYEGQAEECFMHDVREVCR